MSFTTYSLYLSTPLKIYKYNFERDKFDDPFCDDVEYETSRFLLAKGKMNRMWEEWLETKNIFNSEMMKEIFDCEAIRFENHFMNVCINGHPLKVAYLVLVKNKHTKRDADLETEQTVLECKHGNFHVEETKADAHHG